MSILRNSEQQLQPMLSDLVFRGMGVWEGQSDIAGLCCWALFSKPHLDLLAFFPPLNCHLCFPDTS